MGMKHTLNMIERMETAVANSTVTFKHNLKDSPTPWSWSTDTTKEHRGFVTRVDALEDVAGHLILPSSENRPEIKCIKTTKDEASLSDSDQAVLCAAPEMYEALMAMYDISYDVTDIYYESDIKPALELVRDAILKAEQGTPNN